MSGAILKQLLSRLLGGIPRDMREAIEKTKTSLAGGLLLSNVTDIVKKTVTPLLRLLALGMLSINPPKHRREIVRVLPNMRAPLTRRPYTANKIVRYFRETVRVLVSPTLVDNGSCREMWLPRH